jgi:hypothetical protein
MARLRSHLLGTNVEKGINAPGLHRVFSGDFCAVAACEVCNVALVHALSVFDLRMSYKPAEHDFALKVSSSSSALTVAPALLAYASGLLS